MDVQKLFEALEKEPPANRLRAAIHEWIRQGFRVTVDEKYYFESELDVLSTEMIHSLSAKKGLPVLIENPEGKQRFRLHFPDRKTVVIGGWSPVELIPFPNDESFEE
jgi:hypothetical protein